MSDILNNLFWVSADIPVIEEECEEDRNTRLSKVKASLGVMLGESLVDSTAMDSEISVIGENDKSYYRLRCSSVLVHPDSLLSSYVHAYDTIKSCAEKTTFKNAQDQIEFLELLEQLKPRQVSVN